MFPGKHAAIAPTRPAIIMAGTGQTMTYAELELGSRRLANLLRRHCLHAGDHLAVLMDNHLRYLEVVWGALRCGLQITTVNRYLTGPEAAYIVADCGATALITSEAMADVAQQVSDACPELTLKLMVGPAATGFSPYDADTAAQDDSTPEVEPLGEFMLYSSGTTGVPKGILRPLSGRSITDGPAVVTGLGAVFGFNDRTVYLSSAPLYHARAPPGDRQPVGPHHVHPDAQAPRTRTAQLRLEHHDAGDPRRRPLPRSRQAADDRLVGPDPGRVLRRLRRRGHDHVQLRGVARPQRHRRARRPWRRARLRRSTTETPTRPSHPDTRNMRAGPRWATSATSTATATST